MNLHEEIYVEPASPQALGRKKNNMIYANSLHDQEFKNWVYERMQKSASDNGIRTKELTVDMIQNGMKAWDQYLRTNDPEFQKYANDWGSYSQRFVTTAMQLIQEKGAGMDSVDQFKQKLQMNESTTSSVLQKYKAYKTKKS
jgi:hypothetical protein